MDSSGFETADQEDKSQPFYRNNIYSHFDNLIYRRDLMIRQDPQRTSSNSYYPIGVSKVSLLMLKDTGFYEEIDLGLS